MFFFQCRRLWCSTFIRSPGWAALSRGLIHPLLQHAPPVIPPLILTCAASSSSSSTFSLRLACTLVSSSGNCEAGNMQGQTKAQRINGICDAGSTQGQTKAQRVSGTCRGREHAGTGKSTEDQWHLPRRYNACLRVAPCAHVRTTLPPCPAAN